MRWFVHLTIVGDGEDRGWVSRAIRYAAGVPTHQMRADQNISVAVSRLVGVLFFYDAGLGDLKSSCIFISSHSII